ncbi:hypothetical protein N869_09810, partial [Cellulomonas bogoriensis 69B4 = DSM 16987]
MGRWGRGRPRRWAALWAVVLGLLVLSGGPAWAHVELVQVDPPDGQTLQEAPPHVTLTFDDDVDLVPGGMLLYGPDGRAVTLEAEAQDRTVTVTVPEGLGRGTWVLTWRVLAHDAHAFAGSTAFSVSTATPLPDLDLDQTSPVTSVLHTTLQGLTYAGVLVVTGLAILRTTALRGVPVPPVVAGRLRTVGGVAALLAALAAALMLPVLTAWQLGLGPDALLGPDPWRLGLRQPWALSAALVVVGVAACWTGLRVRSRVLAAVGAWVGAALAVGAFV